MSNLVDFAVITIFAREVLEGAIIIGEYRTIILRGNSLQPGITKEEALREVTLSALFATAFALLVIAAVAIPLAVLSSSFDPSTSKIIEAVSKIVAALSLLQLSLKLPKWLGVYGSRKKKKTKKTKEEPVVEQEDEEQQQDVENNNEAVPQEEKEPTEEEHDGLSKRSIRFNVAWNIWREVAECGVFLIPFFLSGDGVIAIPLSAVIGFAVGLALGLGIYFANQRLKNKIGLTVFAVLLLVVLSAGLFTGGCHILEVQLGSTQQVWALPGDFWSVDRLPMTIFKPFGYNDTRTVLEIVCFWTWLALAGLLHARKYVISPKIPQTPEEDIVQEEDSPSVEDEEAETVEMGESSLEGSLGRSSSRELPPEMCEDEAHDERV